MMFMFLLQIYERSVDKTQLQAGHISMQALKADVQTAIELAVISFTTITQITTLDLVSMNHYCDHFAFPPTLTVLLLAQI